MVGRDEQFQCAGDDAEFDREAGEGLAVDLCVDGIRIERLAADGVGFEEFHAFRAAKFVKPERRQIAQIPQATLCGEGEDFEAVLEEIGFGSDLERAAIVLRSPLMTRKCRNL